MARKENWLTRRLSAKSRDFAKRALCRINGYLRYLYQIDPALSGKLFPMSPGQHGYVIAPQEDLQMADGQAVPPRNLRLGEGDAKGWLEGGVSDIERMAALLRTADFGFSDASRILDYGCSAGRMIRHLDRILESTEVWGVDVASEHIYWNQLHLDGRFNFATVTTLPSLPFEDNYFGLVYAGSVFTHIDDLCDATLLELRRITKGGGLLYLTFLDDSTIEQYRQHADNTFYQLVLNSKFYQEYEATNAVKFVFGRSLNSYVYFRTKFLRAKLSKWFELLAVQPQGYGTTQTVYLLRKRA
jgi:ubiquinone/menaquinone biosynthesis C-methylase UbiE